jgi:hypothetical protein
MLGIRCRAEMAVRGGIGGRRMAGAAWLAAMVLLVGACSSPVPSPTPTPVSTPASPSPSPSPRSDFPKPTERLAGVTVDEAGSGSCPRVSHRSSPDWARVRRRSPRRADRWRSRWLDRWAAGPTLS